MEPVMSSDGVYSITIDSSTVYWRRLSYRDIAFTFTRSITDLMQSVSDRLLPKTTSP